VSYFVAAEGCASRSLQQSRQAHQPRQSRFGRSGTDHEWSLGRDLGATQSYRSKMIGRKVIYIQVFAETTLQ